jgi:hypothetical protein
MVDVVLNLMARCVIIKVKGMEMLGHIARTATGAGIPPRIMTMTMTMIMTMTMTILSNAVYKL